MSDKSSMEHNPKESRAGILAKVYAFILSWPLREETKIQAAVSEDLAEDTKTAALETDLQPSASPFYQRRVYSGKSTFAGSFEIPCEG